MFNKYTSTNQMGEWGSFRGNLIILNIFSLIFYYSVRNLNNFNVMCLHKDPISQIQRRRKWYSQHFPEEWGRGNLVWQLNREQAGPQNEYIHFPNSVVELAQRLSPPMLPTNQTHPVSLTCTHPWMWKWQKHRIVAIYWTKPHQWHVSCTESD